MTDDSQVSDPVPTAELAKAVEGVWVAAQKTSWSSLVVVPADTGLPTAEIAQALADVGTLQRGEPVESMDLSGLPLGRSRPMVEALSDPTPFGRVVAVDCPLESQTALLLASAAGAAVLVVERETTRVEAARRVVEQVGPDRFLGAVVLAPAT